MGSTRRSKERKPQYLKDIERIFNPKTAEDLTFALTVPLSPVHKEFMNQLTQAAENEAIIEWLIEKFLIKHHKMREKEKEAIIRQMWMKHDSENERAKLHYSDMRKMEDARAKLAAQTRAQLEQMEVKLRSDLKNLGATIKVHQATLADLTAKKNQNTQQYRASVTNAFQQNIQTHQIQLRINRRDSNGNMTETVLQDPMVILNEVMAETPAPVDLVMQVKKSYIETGKAFEAAMAQKKTAIEFMPPQPPPLPRPVPSPVHLTKMGYVNLELNMKIKAAGSNKAADILAMNRNEKDSYDKLFKLDTAVIAGQCAIFEDALKVGGEMQNCVRQLNVAREVHKMKSEILDELLECKKRPDLEEQAPPPTPGNSHS